MSPSPFSRRLPDSLVPSPFAARLAELRAAGAVLLDLTESNPTRVGLDYLDASILAPLASPAALDYAPDPAGLATARAAVATYHGGAVGPEEIVLTASTSEGYAHLLRLLADPGDVVHVPRPSYPLLEPLAAFESVALAPYPLRVRDAAWRLDVGALAASLTARSRAIVVVSPHHPTGSCLDPDEAEAVVALCAERGLALVADQVFADFVRPGGRRLRIAYAGEDRILTFALSGLSKVAGLPQLKASWIAISGPPRVRDEARARLEWIADAFLSVSTPVQVALPRLLAGSERFRAAACARLEANRGTLAAAAAACPDLELAPSDGGWTAVVRLGEESSDDACAFALLERGIVVHPGYFYEFEEPGWVVVSLLPEPEAFARAIEHLVAVAEVAVDEHDPRR